MLLLAATFGQIFVISMLAVLLLAVLFSLVFFVRSLSQIKQTKLQQDDIIARLEVGKRVSLNSGVLGVITAIHSETVDIEVKSKAILEVYKTSIKEVL